MTHELKSQSKGKCLEKISSHNIPNPNTCSPRPGPKHSLPQTRRVVTTPVKVWLIYLSDFISFLPSFSLSSMSLQLQTSLFHKRYFVFSSAAELQTTASNSRKLHILTAKCLNPIEFYMQSFNGYTQSIPTNRISNNAQDSILKLFESGNCPHAQTNKRVSVII